MRPQLILLLVASLAAPMAAGQETIQWKLTTTDGSQSGRVWQLSSDQVFRNCPHAWSIRKERLTGGRQDGVDLITINNGRFTMTVCPTRGMGIMNVTMGELELKWDSPVQEIVNPQFVNLNSRGGLGWLEGFNEFMCRCGLESNGHPGTDSFINNVGDEAEMELTLHGKIANIPAREVEVVVETKPPYAIHIKGQVDEKLLFGPKLELHTDLVIVPGSTSFRINDVIKNVGAQDQEFQILYHANFGSPLLEKGAEVVTASKKVTPFNDRAAEGLTNWSVYEAPTTGFVEQVYLLELQGDHEGNTMALLHNSDKSLAASINWSLKELPYLTVWKNTGATADGYVTGIEPGTNYPNNRSVEREAGRVPVLKPGESRSMTVQFNLHGSPQSVAKAIRSIADFSNAPEVQIKR